MAPVASFTHTVQCISSSDFPFGAVVVDVGNGARVVLGRSRVGSPEPVRGDPDSDAKRMRNPMPPRMNLGSGWSGLLGGRPMTSGLQMAAMMRRAANRVPKMARKPMLARGLDG